MDLGKDPSRLALQNTPAPQQEQNHVPEFIGRWNLRNREQLRKRKAEAQAQQTSQWQLGAQKKGKRQRTGKENERRGRKKQNTEPKMVLESPQGREKVDKAAVPTERGETEAPMDVAEAPIAPPPKTVPEKHLSEVGQESITGREESSGYRETAVQNQPSEICQDMAEPEDLAPQTCQEKDLPFNTCHDTAEPKEFALQMCQDVDVPKAALPKTSEDDQDVEGCAVETRPDLDASEGCSPDELQERVEPQEWNAELGQEPAEMGSYFPNTQPEIAVPNHLSTKAYSEPDLPEHSSHKPYQETAVPQSLSEKTIQATPEPEDYPFEVDQETPGPEVCAPEMYQETPGPEVCAPEIYQETPGPEVCAPEMYQKTPGPETCAPETYQETSGPEDCAPEMYQETPGPEICAPEIYQETSGPEDCAPEMYPETPGPEVCAPEMYQETPGPAVCAPETYQETPGSEYSSPELYQETPGTEDLSTKAHVGQDVPTECFPEPKQETEIKEKPKADDPERSASPNVPQESHPEQDIFSYALF